MIFLGYSEITPAESANALIDNDDSQKTPSEKEIQATDARCGEEKLPWNQRDARLPRDNSANPGTESVNLAHLKGRQAVTLSGGAGCGCPRTAARHRRTRAV